MVESQGLVTVVVSVYNIERLLPHCLASISAQTYRNLEILLIDDGSTDGSGRVCDEYAASEPRARVIHQENKGLWAVRNRGVEEARGEYLFFPDGDDYFHRDYVRLMYEAINHGGEEYPLAICDYLCVFDHNGDTVSDSEPVMEEMGQKELMDLITRIPSSADALWGANWNKLYRKSALPEPFQKPYRRCQDYDSNLRVFACVDRAVHVHKVLYYWVQWSGQSTRSHDDELIRNECRSRIFLDHFLNMPAQLSDFRPYLLANLYRRLIIWKIDARGTDEWRTALSEIRRMERKTLFPFFTCKRLTLRRKMHLFLSLHAPCLLERQGRQITLEKA